MQKNSAFPLISIEDLIFALEESQDGIIISDNEGNTIYSNPSANFPVYPHKFSDYNVRDMVRKKIIDRSVIWEAIESKSPVTGAVKTQSGGYVVSTATPVLDDNGNVLLAITNVRHDNKLEIYATALREATSNVERYKSVINYISNTKSSGQKIVTRSKKMLELMEYLRKVAVNDSSVLITGESGTGKELISSFIHEYSHRHAEPFVPVNCASIPRDLAESEFFGYEKGAFSGASSKGKPGLFELAHHGTLFLDEIAEMPLEIQSKFLRVLETGTFLRVGGTSPIQTNVRIIAATNRKLHLCILDGTFREDLYYRLNVIPVEIPPLRDRIEDILYLADYFLAEYNIQHNTSYKLSEAIKKTFLQYDWPGNVRELKNYIERYTISPDNGALQIEILTGQVLQQYSKNKTINELIHEQEKQSNMTLKEVTRAAEIFYIQKIIEECKGNITLAASRLGIHRSMLHRKIRDYQL